MIGRLLRVLDGIGHPIDSSELLDVLLLARTIADSGKAAEAAGAVGGEEGEPQDDTPLSDVDVEQPVHLTGSSGVGPDPMPRQESEQPARQPHLLFPDTRAKDLTAGSAAHAMRVPGPRPLPGTNHLARSLRPLRAYREHPHRTVVDVEATVRLAAESDTFDVVLQPAHELRNAAVLLVDDSSSMRVWRSLSAEVGRLLQRGGIFRTVQIRRFSPPDLAREARGSHRTGADPTVTFLLTDGVHPAWSSAAVANALAVLGARGPLAALTPLPQRLWRTTALQPQPYLLKATQPLPALQELIALDPLSEERQLLAPGQLSLPVVALLPSSLGTWSQLVARPATAHLIDAAVLDRLGVDVPEDADTSEYPEFPSDSVPPDRLIAAFRGAFSPQAYRLAVRLSAITPLSPHVMQLVRAAALPEATSTHVAEVLLGGLLRRLEDGDCASRELPASLYGDDLYAFQPGVRELLSSGLSRAQTQEVTEAVGRALEPYLGRLPDFAVLTPSASGTVRLSEEASPFAALEAPAAAEQPASSSGASDVLFHGEARLTGLGGVALVRASARAVAAAARSGTLIPFLIEQHLLTRGHKPSRPQVTTWEHGLVTLATVLTDAGLADVEMLVEYALPRNSVRIQVVLAGVDPGHLEPSYVLVDLKQWAAAVPDEDNPDLCRPDGYVHLVLNPVERMRRFSAYLVRFNDVLSRHPQRVVAAVYLPNAGALGVDGLQGNGGDRRVELFTGDRRSAFLDFLRVRFSCNHPGDRAADELLAARPLPPSRLFAVAAPALNERQQFVLLGEQQVAYSLVLRAVRRVQRSGHKEVVIVSGGPGTGKSTIALQLLGDLYRQGVNVSHATGSPAFTRFLRTVGGRRRSAKELFRYFNSFMQAEPNMLDVLICDEAQRIRATSVNRYTTSELRTGKSQIDELIDVARVTVFLLDEHQNVRPGELGTVAEIKSAAERKGLPVRLVELEGNFRCGGSDVYTSWVLRLLGLEPGGPVPWEPDGRMQILVADDPQDMEAFLRQRQIEGYSVRMTAGYCWRWSSLREGGDELSPDVVIGDWARPWPSLSDRSVPGAPSRDLWATDPAGFGQVGNVYTAQGFEYDWCGVIIGPDMVWRRDGFVTDRTGSRDPALTRSTSDEETDRLIRNAYKVLLTRGLVGTVVCPTDPETRARLLEQGAQPLTGRLRRPEEMLHESQRQIAYRPSYNGPAQVTGGPGTGKTLVALHRVRHLLTRSPGTRLLLASYSEAAAAALQERLSVLLEHDTALLDRVVVTGIDAYAHGVVAQTDGTASRLLSRDEELRLWQRVVRTLDLPWDERFMADEYRHVVLAQDLRDRPSYLRAARLGRGRPLSPQRRALVWSAVELFESNVEAQGFMSSLRVCLRAAELLAAGELPAVDHVVVDEAQELHPAQWRVLRAAVAQGFDDLFITGDPHQRTHKGRVSFRSLGISVVGRSSRLTLSYRSTEEILRFSAGLFTEALVEDLSGHGADTLADHHSLQHGSPPVVSMYATEGDEMDALVDRVRGWIAQGVRPSDIGVCARFARILERAHGAMAAAGVIAVRVEGSRSPREDGVHLVSMHRMKGLEFRCVAVLGLSAAAGQLGAHRASPEADASQDEEDLLRERSLLFLACTRAREELSVSWSGTAGPLVPELTEHGTLAGHPASIPGSSTDPS
ncbi:UvrD-like helicase family protein [Streptomyces sp. PanSC19]|uniref:SAV_2336 N-terminal domain-related protein n=1 Tax=Streptomyces sp. PanSC19 TaxID=1520455 RepID=UPI000F4637FD|nr:SAV_2336 N-terminal domain-related protein [Streptomyces sp. PanSC19]ROQ35005.1 UvrD-like helicase family protein [Streptomyces sp. PanSC19]